MKEFVEYVVKQLVDEPDQVKVSEVRGEKTSIYELKVAKQDIGKVLGKKGRTIDSIRLLVGAVAKSKQHAH